MSFQRATLLRYSLAFQALLLLLAILSMFVPKIDLQNITSCTYAVASPWGYAVWGVFLADLLFRFTSAGATILGQIVAALLALFPAVRLLGARYMSEGAFGSLYIPALGLLPLVFAALILLFGVELFFHYRVRKTNFQLAAAMLFFVLWECQGWVCA